MKPEQFIREFGLGRAREVVEGAPVRANWYQVKGKYSNDLYSCNHELYGEAIMLSDLKRLVESLDLVESWGGIDDVKLYDLSHCKDKPESAGYKLLQAIRDHESIYGGGHES